MHINKCGESGNCYANLDIIPGAYLSDFDGTYFRTQTTAAIYEVDAWQPLPESYKKGNEK